VLTQQLQEPITESAQEDKYIHSKENNNNNNNNKDSIQFNNNNNNNNNNVLRDWERRVTPHTSVYAEDRPCVMKIHIPVDHLNRTRRI
jgi:hypothetical protein